MKAAVLYKPGEAPKYADFPDPLAAGDDEVLITVKAAAVKNLDRGIASGAHYSSEHTQPRVVGIDGVGVTADGTRVYAMGVTGMMAEKAVVDKSRMVKLPDGIDFASAAALPNAIFGSAGALRLRAGIQPGETVLINGATGVTGMVALQVARYFGAKKIIVTGRNPELLQKLRDLGADEVVSLVGDDGHFIKAIREIHADTPIDIVIDYTWARPAELIFAALQGKGNTTHKLRYVTIGAMAGDKIQLSSSVFRSADVTLMGSGFGSMPKDAMNQLFSSLLPELLQRAADGRLKIDTVKAGLKDIEATWQMDIPAGKRLVIVMD